MYSPRIKEELTPKIYKVAKKKGISMTSLVNEILREDIKVMTALKTSLQERSVYYGYLCMIIGSAARKLYEYTTFINVDSAEALAPRCTSRNGVRSCNMTFLASSTRSSAI